jgi:hypothetical protein
MLRRVIARLGHALDLARLFDLPDWHPDRMIAAQIVLYVGLGIFPRSALEPLQGGAPVNFPTPKGRI